MIEKQRIKFDELYRNYLDGNLTYTANKIRKLTKVQIASLLIEWHLYSPSLVGNREWSNDWERFILIALEGYYTG